MRFHIEMSILWKLPCVHFADDLLVALLWSDWGQTFPFRAETIDADEEPRCSEAAGQCIDAPTDGGQHQEYWKELLMLISRLLINWSNLILLSELNQDWCSLENGNVLCTLLKWSLLLTYCPLKTGRALTTYYDIFRSIYPFLSSRPPPDSPCDFVWNYLLLHLMPWIYEH